MVEKCGFNYCKNDSGGFYIFKVGRYTVKVHSCNHHIFELSEDIDLLKKLDEREIDNDE